MMVKMTLGRVNKSSSSYRAVYDLEKEEKAKLRRNRVVLEKAGTTLQQHSSTHPSKLWAMLNR